MTIINETKHLLELFKDFNSGGLSQYDDDEQALIFRFESCAGGEKEDYTLLVIFSFVEYFHLPLSLDGFSIEGYGIDEIKVLPEKEAQEIMPSLGAKSISYKSTDYRCYGFFANGKQSPFYIYCSAIEGELKQHIG